MDTPRKYSQFFTQAIFGVLITNLSTIFAPGRRIKYYDPIVCRFPIVMADDQIEKLAIWGPKGGWFEPHGALFFLN
jgi:hypothetical protein